MPLALSSLPPIASGRATSSCRRRCSRNGRRAATDPRTQLVDRGGGGARGRMGRREPHRASQGARVCRVVGDPVRGGGKKFGRQSPRSRGTDQTAPAPPPRGGGGFWGGRRNYCVSNGGGGR